MGLQIGFCDASQFHEVAEQPCFERLIPVNRDRKADVAPSFTVNMMAALHAQQRSAMALE